MRRLGSSTFKRKDLVKGLEPDECYCIQHQPQVRGKKTLDLRSDPPLDLVVEVDISYHAIKREATHAALGVPEVWRFDGLQLIGLRLTADRQYQPVETSIAFPFLQLAHVEQFVKQAQFADETALMREFQAWAKTLVRQSSQ